MANTVRGSVASLLHVSAINRGFPLVWGEAVKGVRTLNPNMDVVRSLGLFSGVLVGFGEGVCEGWC